jgi:hypothetical protein
MQISNLINKIFERKGITKITELSPDEKVEYDRWQAIMDGSEITVAKIKAFCEFQVKTIEGKYATGESTDKQDTYLRASLHIYLNLIKLIDSPEIERGNLEKYLTTLITQ